MIDQICVLAPAEHIEEIRNIAATLSYFPMAEKLLTIKLSATGEEPATHYFCASNYSPKIHKSILELKNNSPTDYTEVFVGCPKEFLNSKNLKVIK